MTEFSAALIPAALEAYDFGWLKGKTLVDIAGGHGKILTEILLKHREIRGKLFDLEHVVTGAKPRIESLGLTARCSVCHGDFFCRSAERRCVRDEAHYSRLGRCESDDDFEEYSQSIAGRCAGDFAGRRHHPRKRAAFWKMAGLGDAASAGRARAKRGAISRTVCERWIPHDPGCIYQVSDLRDRSGKGELTGRNLSRDKRAIIGFG